MPNALTEDDFFLSVRQFGSSLQETKYEGLGLGLAHCAGVDSQFPREILTRLLKLEKIEDFELHDEVLELNRKLEKLWPELFERLKVSDRIWLSGGYDMDPAWLKGGRGYAARVTGFFDNEIAGRTDEERMAAAIEFDEEIEHKGFAGCYGFILARWEGQRWETEGTVHLHIANVPITETSDIAKENNLWAESHASYKRIAT